MFGKHRVKAADAAKAAEAPAVAADIPEVSPEPLAIVDEPVAVEPIVLDAALPLFRAICYSVSATAM